MHERGHILKVLQSTREAIKNSDVIKLKELSNQTIHTASTTQDTDSILIAVIIYSIGKIIERKTETQSKQCSEFCAFASKEIEKAISSLKRNDEKTFNQDLQNITKGIGKLSKDFKNYVENVFTKARINKASKLYEHGISMEQTAELLGLTMYEVASYAGQRSEASEAPEVKTISTHDRIKMVMNFFGK